MKTRHLNSWLLLADLLWSLVALLLAYLLRYGATWNANITLFLSGDRLIWSSERGTAVYVRCGSRRDGMDKSLLAG